MQEFKIKKKTPIMQACKVIGSSFITTAHGKVPVDAGNYIILEKGVIHICSENYFNENYEPAEELDIAKIKESFNKSIDKALDIFKNFNDLMDQ